MKLRYRTTTPYDRSRRNESRADRVEWALAVSTDREGEQEPAGRARDKMLALVGRENAEALFSMHRETAKGIYRIPAERAAEAKAITGVSGFRDGNDLMRCWPSTYGRA